MALNKLSDPNQSTSTNPNETTLMRTEETHPTHLVFVVLPFSEFRFVDPLPVAITLAHIGPDLRQHVNDKENKHQKCDLEFCHFCLVLACPLELLSRTNSSFKIGSAVLSPWLFS